MMKLLKLTGARSSGDVWVNNLAIKYVRTELASTNGRRISIIIMLDGTRVDVEESPEEIAMRIDHENNCAQR